MNLHSNKELFDDMITYVSEYFHINQSIIEKDYYVSSFLKKLIKADNNFVFKGGTSLSKCYKTINRFSEDIDLNYDSEIMNHSVKKEIKEVIKTVVSDLGFVITNLDDTKSGRDFNLYKVKYDEQFKFTGIKPYIFIETAFQTKSFPIEIKFVNSYIYDYLKENNKEYIIKEYELDCFPIKVQTIERTFIDKVYAICDYFISKQIKEHSRHIYDIYKLFKFVDKDKIKQMVYTVKIERAQNQFCYSAQDNININELLKQIIDTQIYKNDFNMVTSLILFEKIDYYLCINVLNEIINLNLFV